MKLFLLLPTLALLPFLGATQINEEAQELRDSLISETSSHASLVRKLERCKTDCENTNGRCKERCTTKPSTATKTLCRHRCMNRKWTCQRRCLSWSNCAKECPNKNKKCLMMCNRQPDNGLRYLKCKNDCAKKNLAKCVSNCNIKKKASSSITFVATSNENLKPSPLQKNRQNLTINSLLRQTPSFRSNYKPRNGAEAGSQVFLIRGSPIASSTKRSTTLPTDKGLVGTILAAYNGHHNLRLRPDDFWIAILAQFSAYINGQGRAEKLRHRIVAHEGKKQLEVVGLGNIYTADFALMTRLMLDEIAKNIKDSSLREWFLPGFTTSTKKDDVCASAAAMSSLQPYFGYKMSLICGIPEVTLLGTVEDWQELRAKMDRLAEFDTEENLISKKWLPMLQYIGDNLIESAKNGSKRNLAFWDTIASDISGGSGPIYISGWITAFTFFDEKGKRTKHEEHKPDTSAPGAPDWPKIDTNDVNHNIMSTPVTIDDNGIAYNSSLFVGQMAYDVMRQSRPPPPGIMKSGTSVMYRLQPRSDWALAIEKRKEKKEAP